MNKIEVYQGNTKNITCTVSGLDNLDGYTGTLMVKMEARSDTELFEVTGTIEGMGISFVVSATDNTLDAGEYTYEIVIVDGTNVFTLAQDVYEVVESVKY